VGLFWHALRPGRLALGERFPRVTWRVSRAPCDPARMKDRGGSCYHLHQ
jgi:hypothetical protein